MLDTSYISPARAQSTQALYVRATLRLCTFELGLWDLKYVNCST